MNQIRKNNPDKQMKIIAAKSEKKIVILQRLLIVLFGAMVWTGYNHLHAHEYSSDNAISFEGKMTISRYAVSANGSKELLSSTPLLIHSDFILLEDSQGGRINLMGNIRADGVLVRQQKEDFVFFTPDRQAVILSKQELQQMINMLENMRNGSGNRQSGASETVIEKTGNHSIIEGYSAVKWIVKKEKSISEWHVWITDELTIQWGVLSESWLSRQIFSTDLPDQLQINDQNIPLKAEFWNGGKLAEVLVVENISSESLSESAFKIPDGYQQINFQEMLFNRMRNR